MGKVLVYKHETLNGGSKAVEAPEGDPGFLSHSGLQILKVTVELHGHRDWSHGFRSAVLNLPDAATL